VPSARSPVRRGSLPAEMPSDRSPVRRGSLPAQTAIPVGRVSPVPVHGQDQSPCRASLYHPSSTPAARPCGHGTSP
jgi:hypothetical protein